MEKVRRFRCDGKVERFKSSHKKDKEAFGAIDVKIKMLENQMMKINKDIENDVADEALLAWRKALMSFAKKSYDRKDEY